MQPSAPHPLLPATTPWHWPAAVVASMASCVAAAPACAALPRAAVRGWAACALAAALLAAGAPAHASQALRCEGRLVGKGESPLSLLHKCGEPVYRQAVCVSMLQLGWIVAPARGNGPAAVLANQCVPMEEWFYDRGPGTFYGVVRLHNGVIESVRDGDRRP